MTFYTINVATKKSWGVMLMLFNLYSMKTVKMGNESMLMIQDKRCIYPDLSKMHGLNNEQKNIVRVAIPDHLLTAHPRHLW